MKQLSRSDFDALLQQSPFAGIPQNERDALYEEHRLLQQNRKQEVFRSDFKARRFFLVASGSYRLVLKNGSTKVLDEGTLFGEVGALTDTQRLGSVAALENNSALAAFSRDALVRRGLLPSPEEPGIAGVLYGQALSYLRDQFDNSTETLLEQGEGMRVEFKESERNEKIAPAIASFLNTGGGTLLIGVNDRSEVIGIEGYSLAKADQFDQDLQNMLRAKLGTSALPYIHFCHNSFEGKGIYRIDCEPAEQPVLLNNGTKKGEQFMIRSGATMQQLGFRDALRYIARRFPDEFRNE